MTTLYSSLQDDIYHARDLSNKRTVLAKRLRPILRHIDRLAKYHDRSVYVTFGYGSESVIVVFACYVDRVADLTDLLSDLNDLNPDAEWVCDGGYNPEYELGLFPDLRVSVRATLAESGVCKRISIGEKEVTEYTSYTTRKPIYQHVCEE